jgi:hypothetical protein
LQYFLVTFVILIANSARFKGKQIEQYQETIEKIRQENIELKIQNQIKTYLKENQNKNPEKTK